MKIKFLILILAISILGFTSCIRQSNCDNSREKNLGRIDYSNEFQEFEIEIVPKKITFSNSTDELVFTKNENPNPPPRRLNEYIVCESINIKPYTAYAFHEYDNLENVFLEDSSVLVLNPEIEKIGDQRGESLYINFGQEGVGNIKGRVPINNIDTTITYQPFGELFKFRENINIGNQPFEKIWFFRKGNMGMYYSKENGVVALEAGGEFYYRNQ